MDGENLKDTLWLKINVWGFTTFFFGRRGGQDQSCEISQFFYFEQIFPYIEYENVFSRIYMIYIYLSLLCECSVATLLSISIILGPNKHHYQLSLKWARKFDISKTLSGHNIDFCKKKSFLGLISSLFWPFLSLFA